MKAWRGPALLAVVVFTAYANALTASFQFDDWNVIVRDARVQSLASWWDSMPGIRPLLKLSYALNHATGQGVAGFHAVNVAIHLLNALLVRALLERLLRVFGTEHRIATVGALAGAIVFALHPLQTEAVTYASGRSTSLAAALVLGSIVSWIDGRARSSPWLVHVLSPLLFACALGVKEYAAVLPLALALIAGLDRSGPPRARALAVDLGVHAWVLALGALLALASPDYRHLLATSLGTRDLLTNLRTQAHAIVDLTIRLVRFDRLCADPALPVLRAWSPTVVLEATTIGTALAAGLLWFRSRRVLAFGILWFLIWLVPTNSLLPRLDVANERALYVPLIGAAGIAGWAFAQSLARAGRLRFAVIAAGLALAAVLGAATHARNRVYADEIGFWADVVRKAPQNPRAHNNLGHALALACRSEEAAAAFRRAMALDPGDYRATINLQLLERGELPGTESCR